MSDSNKHIRCWNDKGIWGDCSCELLSDVIHCHNCKIYAKASKTLFERPVPSDYFDEWSFVPEVVTRASNIDTPAVFVFECSAKLFALPLESIVELATMRMIHSLPFKRENAIIGITNINGELVPVFDIYKLLELDSADKLQKSIVVCSNNADKFAFTIESVRGAIVPDKDSIKSADNDSPWYVLKYFKVSGETAILINSEILITALQTKKL